MKRKARSVRRWIAIAALALFGVALAWQVLSRSSGTRLSVDPGRLTMAAVQNGEFLEYYPFDGTVEPATSVYLDIEEGGRVDEIFVEGGAHVEKGDLILRFSNARCSGRPSTPRRSLLENLDIQRNTQFNRAQSSLLLQGNAARPGSPDPRLEKKYRRYETLMTSGDSPISAGGFETTRDQLKYLKDKRALMAERIRQEDILSAKQIAQAQTSIGRLNRAWSCWAAS